MIYGADSYNGELIAEKRPDAALNRYWLAANPVQARELMRKQDRQPDQKRLLASPVYCSPLVICSVG